MGEGGRERERDGGGGERERERGKESPHSFTVASIYPSVFLVYPVSHQTCRSKS